MTPSPPPIRQRPPIFEFLDVLRRRGLWILAITLIVGAAVYVHEASKPDTFQATSLINYEPSQQNLESLLGVSQSNSDQNINGVTNPQLLTAASLAVSPSVAASASQALGGQPSTAQILRDVTVSADGSGATILQVSATDVSPTTALRVSRAYAGAYVTSQTDAEQATVSTAITRVAAQIRATKRTDANASGALSSLLERQSQLQQINLLSQPPVTIGLLASSATRNAPNTLRTAMLAAVIALILALSVTVVFERAFREDRQGAEVNEVNEVVEAGPADALTAQVAPDPAPAVQPIAPLGPIQPIAPAPPVQPLAIPLAASVVSDMPVGQTSTRELAIMLWSRLQYWFMHRVLPLIVVDRARVGVGETIPSSDIKGPMA